MYQILTKMQVWTGARALHLYAAVCVYIALITLCASPVTLFAQNKPTTQTKKVVPAKNIQKIPQKKPSSSQPPATIPERTAFFPTIGGDTHNTPQQTASSAQPSQRTLRVSYIRRNEKLAHPDLEARVLAATINIVCTVRTRDSVRSSVGSGVVISPEGHVLTNAHVGIYSLFPTTTTTPGEANCVARTGSPAAYAFDLEPVYVPRAWVAQYADKLFKEKLSGTGAGDYMLLKRKIYGDPRTIKMASLPYVTPDVTLGSIIPKDVVLGAGYPAEFLGVENVEGNLAYAASYITVGDALTFAANTPDTFTLPGTILARAGISGGPVVDAWGAVVGIMSTSTREGTTAERTLRTISLDYINRDLLSSISLPLVSLLNPTEQALRESLASRVYTESLLGSLYVK